MRIGDTKYYLVKQIKKDSLVVGDLCLIGRQYGYIVQFYYHKEAGYKVNETFDTYSQAEKRFYEVLNREG